MLNEDKKIIISEFLKEKINKDNVLTFYSLAKYYNLTTISNFSLVFVERCFSMVVWTENFLQLDFDLIAKFLDNSELNIHTEVEIFNVVIAWLKYNKEERSKYAKQLLQKVRLTLMTNHALKYMLECVSVFDENLNFIEIITEVYEGKLKNKLSSPYTNRYCSQNMFSFLICGGYD